MPYKYRRKRDFSRTPEPQPGRDRAKPGPLRFVVQKHQARRLHYDLRLEVAGVLKSWSVPKGPSLDSKTKRLAVMVEDHPLEYRTFEGIIPAGQYGAGQVIVWDEGTYSPDETGFLFHRPELAEQAMLDGLDRGKLSVTVRGSKIRGSWTLVRMQRAKADWLLIKHEDESAQAGVDLVSLDKSVRTGRTLADVEAERPGLEPLAAAPQDCEGAAPSAFEEWVSPMLAAPAARPFSDPGWAFEPKLDGYRALASVRDGRVTILSRQSKNMTANFPELVGELETQPVGQALFDGEIVALDEHGRPAFGLLQNRLGQPVRQRARRLRPPIVYYPFDLIHLDGFDLTQVPLETRKKLLDGVLKNGVHVRAVPVFYQDGQDLFEEAVAKGFEGVVAKKRASTYAAGQRSTSWLKLRNSQTDDFVVAGFTEGKGGRAKTFGALVLAAPDAGGLDYAGRVGTGFTNRDLVDIAASLRRLRTDQTHLSKLPHPFPKTNWVEPRIIAEVRFKERTADGVLRMPVFQRLRDDKSIAELRPVAAPDPEVQPGGTPENEVDQVLEQLREAGGDEVGLKVGDHLIRLTNLNKRFWPATNHSPPRTKRNFLVYLANVAQFMLPHLQNRPLSLHRYPEGILGDHFYQKHWPHGLPGFVDRVALRFEGGKDGVYLLCNNLPTLMWLGQQANLEFHTWFSRVKAQAGEELKRIPSLEEPDRFSDHPDFVAFDLDPYVYSGAEAAGEEPELNRAGFAKTVEVAHRLKQIMDGIGLELLVKTSGATGLHLFAPIEPDLNYQEVRDAAATIGGFLQKEDPGAVTMEWAVKKRKGKIFFDHKQNSRGKTVASVYSPRPTALGTVSTAVTWTELDRIYPTDFTMDNDADRLRSRGDPWANILARRNDLRSLLNRG
ncbi:MAG: DNA ligase D [Terriglobia bacterium]